MDWSYKPVGWQNVASTIVYLLITDNSAFHSMIIKVNHVWVYPNLTLCYSTINGDKFCAFSFKQTEFKSSKSKCTTYKDRIDRTFTPLKNLESLRFRKKLGMKLHSLHGSCVNLTNNNHFEIGHILVYF